MSALTRKLLRSIKTTYRQFIALVAMVMAGVALFVAFNCSLTNLITSRNHYYQEYGFADYYFDVIRAPQGVSRQIQALQGVAQVNGRIQKDINILKGDEQRITGRLISYSQAAEKNLYLIKGASFFQDTATTPSGVLIDPEFAGGNHFSLGDQLKIVASGQEQVLPIIGIATSPEFMVPNKSVFDMFLRGESFGIMMISQHQAEQILDMSGEINEILVNFTPGADAEGLKKEIEGILKPYGIITSYSREDQYSEKNMQFQVDALKSASAFLPLIFFIMVSCFLFILLRQLIKSQRLHIGVLKALGYDNQSITLLFTGYALLVCLMGSTLGTLGGYYLAQMLLTKYAQGFNLPYTLFEMSWDVVVKAFLISTAAGTGSGILACREIVSISPAEAIRTEAPKLGSNSFLERIPSIWDRIPASWRMSLRSIARNHLRFMITCLGIATSVILLVIAMYFYNSSDYLMEHYFDAENKYDYKVRLTNVVRNDEMKEWAKWEGVQAIEPVLEIPVKIRPLSVPERAEREEDDILVGLNPSTRLKNVFNISQEKFTIPEEGILLNRQIAEKLHVQVGDVVKVQTNLTVGPPLQSELKIRGIADQNIGGASFASAQQVDRLLHEKDVSNAVLIQMNKRYAPKMIRHLNDIPGIDYLVDKDKQAERARKSLGNMIYFTLIATISAIVLGFAVVYNISIMNFNERQKELALFKVIGFTNVKISKLLFNELLLALVPGIIIGLISGRYLGGRYIESMATDFITYPVVIYPSTYLIAVILTVCFVFIGHMFAMRRTKSLDIVEVMKDRN
ncbi:ABC transporter permease [Candidatus Formimonas warabiya]|uniref:ABC transporter permease n=1 Tax=Formimonas warabiya TaxID=1761012 RepID=A0A3G1KWQ6_FORW1|nr:FtsX-like permease family protein [Candidatus Formimonas warabiya]ATW26827.1 hypothetical protein DCMF_20520 [Candidatus Formimonas warabiya]